MTTNDDFNAEARIDRATSKAASSVKDGLDVASATADRALQAASDKLDHVRNQAAPAIKQGIDQAKSWVDQNAGRVQDGVRTARNKASDLTDQVVDYTRDEPVKALLIAAAVGAGVMGVLRLLARSDD